MEIRRTILAMAAAASLTSALAQTPAGQVDLQGLTFVRQNFSRNFYSSSLTVSELRMEGTDLFLKNAANLVVDGQAGLRQEGASLRISGTSQEGATVRVGSFHPYLCYEASFDDVPSGASVGIRFSANDGDGSISIICKDGQVSAGRDGGKMSTAGIGPGSDVSLRVQYTGKRFHVFSLGEEGSARLLMSVACDMREACLPVTWSWGVFASVPGEASVKVTSARSALTCGTGQADPQIVQHKDGRPYIKDGRLYICFTSRGFERTDDSYQGVYSIGVSNFDLKLEGALLFGDGDGLMHGYHATKVVWDDDRERFLVMTTTHGGNHTLAWSETSTDILHGLHYLECTQLDFPHNFDAGAAYNTEDPDFFYDAEARAWRLVYCAIRGDGYLTYKTHICTAKRWNGPYRLLAEAGSENHTGIRITTVGGRRYVLSGGPDCTYYIFDYPSLKPAGTFNQKYECGGFRGWPAIVPIPYGNYERYLWITFDRGAITGKYSYGTLYFYLGDKMWKKEQ